MDWKAVYGDFSDLPKSEQHSLFQAIKDTLFPEPKEDIANMVGEIREVRFSSGLACVHCGSVNNKRNGKYRSRQRYICKGCGKSFNDMTANPDFRNHYPHKWLKYFQMMVDGVTLPKIAEELEIHVSTALYWRYKILIALRSIGFSTLKGIIESDETYFLESDKARNPSRIVNLANVASAKSKSAWLSLMTETETFCQKLLDVDAPLPMKSTKH